MIFSVTGVCRRKELCNLPLDNTAFKESYVIIRIPDSKTIISRIFTVMATDVKNFDFIAVIKKYAELRADVNHRRLFVGYFVKASV